METVCEMDICQVGGKTLGIADKVFTSLVTCQGLGKCTKKVHPCCTVTPRACAHAYCCSQKLHDITGNRRLYMCDTCMQALSYIDHRPPAAVPEEKKQQRPRKPTENQKATKYSRANLAWLYVNKQHENKRFEKDLARYYRNLSELMTEFCLVKE